MDRLRLLRTTDLGFTRNRTELDQIVMRRGVPGSCERQVACVEMRGTPVPAIRVSSCDSFEFLFR
jgi:hypothetical protein